MTDTHETIADIIAEKRRQADKIERNCAEMMKRGKMISDSFVSELVADIRREAKRLEAAQKREACGAAKLREALKHIEDRLPHMLQYMRVHWEDASAGGYFDELMLVINDALSTPPRNCDLPEVAKDPWRAWLDDKSNWDEFGSPKLEIHDWLFATATEKEGGAK